MLTIAPHGTASNMPTIPNKLPPSKTKNITQTGCKPNFLPIIFGDITPSKILPNKNTIIIEITPYQDLNWKYAINKELKKPPSRPKKGMKDKMPVVIPINTPKFKPTNNSASE